LSGNETTASFA